MASAISASQAGMVKEGASKGLRQEPNPHQLSRKLVDDPICVLATASPPLLVGSSTIGDTSGSGTLPIFGAAFCGTSYDNDTPVLYYSVLG